MIIRINKNNQAYCWKGKRNGSVVPPSTKELQVHTPRRNCWHRPRTLDHHHHSK